MKQVPFKFYKDQMEDQKKGFMPFLEAPETNQFKFPPWMIDPEAPDVVRSFKAQYKWHSLEEYRYAMSISTIREYQYGYTQIQKNCGEAHPARAQVVSVSPAGHVILEFHMSGTDQQEEGRDMSPLQPHTKVTLREHREHR